MKDSFYFPHYQDARRDIKIQRLRRDLGIEGYGIYFMLLEILREQPDYKFPLQDVELLVKEIDTTRAKIEVVITNYELFETEQKENGQVFFSPKQIYYLLPYTQKKEKAKIANAKSQSSRKDKFSEHTKQLSLLDATSPNENLVNMSEHGSTSQTEQNKTEQIKDTTTKECASARSSSSFDFLFEEWIESKLSGARNNQAYAFTLRQKFQKQDVNLLAEYNAWLKERNKNAERSHAQSLCGKFLYTSQGYLQISCIEFENERYTIYFTEGGFSCVDVLHNLPITDKGE